MPNALKIAIDPGHGMSNAKPNVFDPGAVKKVGSETFAEADIALKYALTFKQFLVDKGIDFFMTRTSSADAAPVGGRATRATNAGCTHFVSLHLNSFSSPTAAGVEVLYRDDAKDAPLAAQLQNALVNVTHFKDRGIKKRTDLAVLKFKPGTAVLIELGFISNDGDRNFLIERDNRIAICQAIVNVLTGT